MLMLRIVSGTSTVAFPLEELGYEYAYDIDPILMAFDLNQTERQFTVPIVKSGTVTVQFGKSSITYSFTSAKVYLINFTKSWNMISNMTYQSALPSNVIYFCLGAR
jgi:hypothetical protein